MEIMARNFLLEALRGASVQGQFQTGHATSFFDQRFLPKPQRVPRVRARCPLVLLLDVSTSMESEIGALSSGVEALGRKLAADGRVADSLDVAVVTFSTEAKVVVLFQDVRTVTMPSLTVEGSTNMGAGIGLALDVIETQRARYQSQGVKSLRPVVLLITDGEADDTIGDIQKRIADGERGGAAAVYGVAINGASVERLQRIVSRPVMALEGVQLPRVFSWLAESMAGHVMAGGRLPEVPRGFRAQQ
jgi:uncharacterized protein YegL